MTNLRYAIWYEPTGELFTELSNLIKNLAAKCNTSIFTPHITLLPGGTDLPLSLVIEKLESIVAELVPFSTELTDLKYSDEFFKSIYIQVEQSTNLSELVAEIQLTFPNQIITNFNPHLSIFYGEIPNSEKNKIITELGNNYCKSFVIQAIDVIQFEIGKPVEDWKKVASLKLVR